jgi:hypothetical protein
MEPTLNHEEASIMAMYVTTDLKSNSKLIWKLEPNIYIYGCNFKVQGGFYFLKKFLKIHFWGSLGYNYPNAPIQTYHVSIVKKKLKFGEGLK